MIYSEDPKYSPFLNWRHKDPISVASIAQVFVSLVSMGRDDFQFDKKLVQKKSSFLCSVTTRVFPSIDVDDFLKAVGQSSTNPAAVDSLSLTRECLRRSSSCQQALLSSKLYPRILSIPLLRDLSVIAEKDVLSGILFILRDGIQITSTDPLYSLTTLDYPHLQSLRDVVLNEVLIPIEPSLVQISRNPHLLSWTIEYNTVLRFLLMIFDVCVFHQPSLHFLCSSHIPMAFQSLLSKLEHVDTHQSVFWLLSRSISRWKESGTNFWRRWRRLFQTLEWEGFRNQLESTLLHEESRRLGRKVRGYSFELLNSLGMNCRSLG
ncbi:hypothetical protein BLNAU_21700 [Blattamonas nauphoetae]|uniref:Uncharacterized protein n=1 Tax=Blattamonas nauphoetae TaxID=2049346 RepID=A0ABQ9WZE1_9EUKA|nr:hypothetical protein BLNAU_21700 [Blattamonas nauphoetae]